MINLDNAIVYDIELLKNVFTCHIELLTSPASFTFEISDRVDMRVAFHAWLVGCQHQQTPMIGFNNVHFDYPLIHYFYHNPNCTVADLYDKMQQIFSAQSSFAHTIWASDRLAPQIDLFKINHFDNKAKTTSLKALQVNMRSETVVDSPVQFGTYLTCDQIEHDLIPYNRHDVKETKHFAQICRGQIDFRINLIEQFGVDVLNYNDVKIGAKTLEKRLGDDLCYEWREVPGQFNDYGLPKRRKFARQTPRKSVALSDIIFPYIRFDHPEFNRVLDYMRAQVLTPDDLDDPDATVKTKGVFKKLIAHVGGLDFYFGTGGMHASVDRQRFIASDDWPIRDIDVAAMYPSIAWVNKLHPEHLGVAFDEIYAGIGKERSLHAKGTPQNASLKLAANGPWGQSNNKHTVFFDPKYAMTIPINGQLMICMLAEWLASVPTLRIIQANTDGITYQVHKSHDETANLLCKAWQDHTGLVLESVDYARMWIADVNTYVAETLDGKLKQKGRLWHPAQNTPEKPDAYARSITEASPPAWHKDLSNCVSIQAAVQAMVNGVDPEAYIRSHTDAFDFMCRGKADRASKMMLGDRQVQNTMRYYVAIDGEPLVKVSPPAGPEGAFKRGIGVTEAQYLAVMAETGGAWDERVCTKNKSRYETRYTAIEAGWKVAMCNDAREFDWTNVNYDWYLAEARKLIIV